MKLKNKEIRLLSQAETNDSVYLFGQRFPLLKCVDFKCQTKYTLKLYFVPPYIAQKIKSNEEAFIAELEAKSAELKTNFKLLYAYISNWFKFKLYDKVNKLDPFSSFEVKHMFAGYLEQLKPSCSSKTLGNHFIDFLWHVCTKLNCLDAQNLYLFDPKTGKIKLQLNN